MRQFGIVWKHEFLGYVRSKSYVGITVGFALLFVVLLSLPAFLNLQGLFSGGGETAETMETARNPYDGTIYLWDESEQVTTEALEAVYPRARVAEAGSEEELRAFVEDGDGQSRESGEEARCGFVVTGPSSYRYYVKNRSFTDSVGDTFESFLSMLYRRTELFARGIDAGTVDEVYGTPVESETIVLGKDSVSNYLYTYLLIFVLYFMILIYGNSVAVSVAQEKSSRAMEVLVTSTSSNSLIFGKVLAGTAASFLQVGVILAAALASYGVNRGAWNGMLDFVFHIPGTVLLSFAVFGVLGYILYAFCYGVLGALVSKTEDVSRISGPLMFIYIVSFLVTMFQMTNSDGILMKVFSFIPFTSPNAMFVRVAMGNVAAWEVALSLVILAASIVVIAVGGARIYRMGTLMYGNPIKLSRAFKMSRENNR